MCPNPIWFLSLHEKEIEPERNPRDGCTQRMGQVRTQRKWSSASQGASPRETQAQPHYDLGCPASGAVRKQMSVVQASRDMLFCYGSPRKLIYKHYTEFQTTWKCLHGFYYNIAKHLHQTIKGKWQTQKTRTHLTKVWHYQ